MRLARLRHQMLVAMGLPACWVQQGPPPASPPPTEVAEDSGSTRIASLAPSGWRDGRFSANACASDTVAESICGRSEAQSGGEACGPTGQALESYGTQRLYVTRFDGTAHSPELSPFQHDPDATAAYQRTVRVANADSYCCYARCSPVGAHRAKPLVQEPGFMIQPKCIPAPPGGTRVPADKAPACPAGIRIGAASAPFVSKRGAQCCYGTLVEERIIEQKYYRGRAARVDGRPVVAPVAGHGAWSAELAAPIPTTTRRRDDPRVPTVDDLDPAVRTRLAAAWLRAAQMEHASIASFSALSLRLLALGAPPALVAAAHAAALDEIRHAQAAYALASAYAGQPLGPAAFGDAGKLAIAGDLTALAVETFVDGCIEETCAAVEAERAADLAGDPAVAAALREIAADEARHAELAWAIVAWCVHAEGPALLEILRSELQRHLAASSTPDDRDDDLAPHGVLGARALAAVRADTLAEVIAPCLAALGAT